MCFFDEFCVGREQAFGVTVEVAVIVVGGKSKRRKVYVRSVKRLLYASGKQVVTVDFGFINEGKVVFNVQIRNSVIGKLVSLVATRSSLLGKLVGYVKAVFESSGRKVVYNRKVYMLEGIKDYRLLLGLLMSEDEDEI